jgi:hypothetical protein
VNVPLGDGLSLHLSRPDLTAKEPTMQTASPSEEPLEVRNNVLRGRFTTRAFVDKVREETERLLRVTSREGAHVAIATAARELAELKLALLTLDTAFAGPGVALTVTQRAEIQRLTS